VEIAKALVSRPRLLILDEATPRSIAVRFSCLFAALRRLRNDGTAIIFVSHRLEEVFAITDRITVLKNGDYVATVPCRRNDDRRSGAAHGGREMQDIFPPKPPIA
jgi:ribose transport system ATP-binding protein